MCPCKHVENSTTALHFLPPPSPLYRAQDFGQPDGRGGAVAHVHGPAQGRARRGPLRALHDLAAAARLAGRDLEAAGEAPHVQCGACGTVIVLFVMVLSVIVLFVIVLFAIVPSVIVLFVMVLAVH